MSCLAKERAARPTDLRALCRAMTATLEGGWSDEASERWWGEHNPGRSWMGAIEQPDPPSGGGTELATGVGQADEGQADHGRVISVEFQTAPMDPGELREARKETIEALKSHFAASHIDFDVFDARSSDALRANDRRDLDRLVADLPKPRVQGDVGRAVPMAAPTREVTTDDYEELPTEDLPIPAGQELPARSAESQLPALVRKDRFVSVFSSTKRLGEWAPAHKTRCVSVFGETKLDLREARLPAGPTDIHCVSVFGATKIIVPPDLFVQADGAAIVGEFSDYSHSVAPPGEGEPWLRVTGIAVLGEVSIKVKKRDGEGLLAKAFKTLVGLAAPTERKRLPAPEEPERDD
jgi:hypothetical protein